ncbi:restriction endonuclease subunit S [Peptacetobacter sp.]|uniref:restriction endonuclease subunit S n=1 Tax=Peptacetobacter sp. TaxID=2991975 RepID=UPI00261DDA4E|nr:restriction endonuclease subunit S [Peptacetobacter sp.]
MEYIKLGDICEIKSSKRIYQSDYVDNGVPFYRGKEISELSRNEDIETELYITEEKYKELNEKFGSVQKGDLLITSVGTIGNTWVSDGRKLYYKDGNITQIVNNDKINTKYISYLFKSNLIKRQYLKGTSGTAQVALTIEKLKNITIPKLSIDEQNKIVEVLDKAQSLIDKKREQIELLDELVKSRFVEMFGDPVLNTKEWEVKKVIDVCECMVPGRDKPKSFTGDIPWITIDDLKINRVTYKSKSDLGLTDDEIKEVKRKKIPKGSVLMSCVGNLGICSIAGEDMIINQQLHSFQCKEINNYFLMYYLGFRKDYMESKASSTTVLYMNKTVCNSIPVYLPPIELQNEFAEFVEQTDSIRSKMEASLSELEDNFNSLMQKAFKPELF